MPRNLHTKAGPLHGFWCATGHPAIIEHAASLGPDFLCIDAQHGTRLDSLTVHTFTALTHSDVPGLVRVPRNDPYDIGLALDLGASGVMTPMIESADAARTTVAASRYPPDGERSYGIQTPRLDAMDPGYRPLCAVQIETSVGVENVDEIASVAGVDWLYIGPADLGISLCGIPAYDVISVFDGSHSCATQVQEAFAAVVEACARHGKLAGLHCNSGDEAIAARENGFSVYSVATDLAQAKIGMENHLDKARGDL